MGHLGDSRAETASFRVQSHGESGGPEALDVGMKELGHLPGVQTQED